MEYIKQFVEKGVLIYHEYIDDDYPVVSLTIGMDTIKGYPRSDDAIEELKNSIIEDGVSKVVWLIHHHGEDMLYSYIKNVILEYDKWNNPDVSDEEIFKVLDTLKYHVTHLSE